MVFLHEYQHKAACSGIQAFSPIINAVNCQILAGLFWPRLFARLRSTKAIVQVCILHSRHQRFARFSLNRCKLKFDSWFGRAINSFFLPFLPGDCTAVVVNRRGGFFAQCILRYGVNQVPLKYNARGADERMVKINRQSAWVQMRFVH